MVGHTRVITCKENARISDQIYLAVMGRDSTGFVCDGKVLHFQSEELRLKPTYIHNMASGESYSDD